MCSYYWFYRTAIHEIKAGPITARRLLELVEEIGPCFYAGARLEQTNLDSEDEDDEVHLPASINAQYTHTSVFRC